MEQETTDTQPPVSKWTRCVLSVFIVFNLITLGFMNRPDWFAKWLYAKIGTDCSPRVAAVLYRIPADVYRYAHFAGLNVKWQMYSGLQRYDFTLIAVGIDANGKAVLLPEPLQSNRTPWQKFFNDFREAKYHLNLLQYPSEQDFYARYLLRTHPEHNGVPIKWVRIDLQYRLFVDSPDEALATGTYFKGPENVTWLYPPREIPK